MLVTGRTIIFVGSLEETIQLFFIDISWHGYKGAYYKSYDRHCDLRELSNIATPLALSSTLALLRIPQGCSACDNRP